MIKNPVLLVLDAAPGNVKETLEFYKNELPKTIKEIPEAIQLAPNILLIDINEGLSKLPKLASICEENHVVCIALSIDKYNHSIQISALTDSKETKVKLEDINKEINKALAQ